MAAHAEPARAAGYTADEMMTVAASRALQGRMTCFVGIGLPSAAANLARATHSPQLVLIYESGTIGTKPGWLPLSIGDGVLAETADSVVSVPEIFNYWLQPGRIDVGFLGAAQIDKFGEHQHHGHRGRLRRAQDQAAGRGWRTGDRGVLPGGDRSDQADPAVLRRPGGLRHVRRLRLRPR